MRVAIGLQLLVWRFAPHISVTAALRWTRTGATDLSARKPREDRFVTMPWLLVRSQLQIFLVRRNRTASLCRSD